MALNKTVIPVVFNMGIDTKTDEKSMNGSLLELENMYQEKTGAFRLRNGFSNLSNQVFADDTINDSIGLATFNQELIQLTEHNLYSYAPGLDKWSDKGDVIFTEVSTLPLVSNSYQQTATDSAVLNGVQVIAWEDSRESEAFGPGYTGCRAMIRDLESGNILTQDIELPNSLERPRCVACGIYLFVFYVSGATLYVTRVDTTNPTEFGTYTTVLNGTLTSPNGFYDVITVGARMVVAARVSGGIKLFYWNQNNTLGGLINGAPIPITISCTPIMGISLTNGPIISNEESFMLSWGQETGAQPFVQFKVFTQSFTEVNANNVFHELLPTYPEYRIRNIAGYNDDGYCEMFIEYERKTGLVYKPENNQIVHHRFAFESAASLVATVVQRAAGIASKPFKASSDVTSIVVSYSSTAHLQDTYFAIDSTGRIEAKILATAGGGHTTRVGLIPSIQEIDDAYYFTCGRKTRIVVGDTTTQSLTGINQVALTYGSSKVGLAAQLGQGLFIPGGYLKVYDGTSVTEQNFHLYPETPTLAEQLASGYLSKGAYQYILVFEWVDGKGQICQSTTSVPGLITTTAANSAVNLTIPTLRYTAKKLPIRTEVTIGIYRNEISGGIFYKVSDDTNPLYNDTTVDTVPFQDTMSDAQLISRPLLYTTGGILDNAPAPAANVVKVAKNRLFAAGLENANEFAYSKPGVAYQQIAFADLFVQASDQRGGKITAIEELDEKIVFFKENTMFYITGDGPDNLGDGTFPITSIAANVGTTEPESVVLTELGIMFKSSKGIMLLDRGLNVSYIGDKVQQYNDYQITSATVVANLNQVRFTTEEGTTLVYDYYYKTWCTYTTQPAVAALTWEGEYVYTSSDGIVSIENDTFTDSNKPIKPIIGTQWFSFAGIQGFQRVYRALLVGDYKGKHTLQVLVYYDYQESPSESYTYSTTTGGFDVPFGDAYAYGDDELYGDLQGIYQFQVNFARQKCEAIRIVIKGLYPDSIGNEGFTLSAVSFLIGQKPGLFRVPDTKIMR